MSVVSATKPKHIYNVKIQRLNPSKLKLKAITRQPLPSKVDLRPSMPDVYNQGELGSCTANALCAAVGFIVKGFTGSRLFVYYNERRMENTIPDDEGAYLCDGVKTLEKYGVCAESDWPYVIKKFAVKPPEFCYINASQHLVLSSSNVDTDLYSMKHALANGFPFVVGISIYTSFESDEVGTTGKVPMPKSNDESLGGHAVLVCGYDDETQMFIVRNSWGPDWGDKGYFYLPYKYLTNPALSSDMWTITAVSNTV
jgi:C1A family cysteine protease